MNARMQVLIGGLATAVNYSTDISLCGMIL